MSLRADIFQTLRRSRNTAVERILDEALAFERADPAAPPGTPPPDPAALAYVLLTRDRRPGWLALIRHFEHLGDAVQRELIERPRELFGPLAESIDDTAGDARANVIRIVRQAADAKLVYLLAEALMDARGEVRSLAAESLLDAIRRFRTSGQLSPQATEHEGPALRRAVDFALQHYRSHRQPAALQAALIYERQQDGALWSMFDDQYTEISRAGNVLLRLPTDPLLAPALFLALATPLRPAAAHGIAAAENRDVCRAIARESFRLIDPLIGGDTFTIPNVTHLKALASPKRDAPWDADTWLGWLRLIEAAGLPADQKLAWLVKMLESPGATPVQKMMALRTLSALNLTEAMPVLATYAADADVRVARVAARALLARPRADVRAFAAALGASPHACVRQMGSLAVGQTRFEKLWQDYHRLPPAVQVNTTRTLASNETSFPDMLRAKLSAAAVGEIAKGLRVLNTLGDVRPFRDEIITLCAHHDSRIAASAVKFAGKLDDPSLLDLLEAAARHTDPRVRANAVEAMDALKIADKSQQVLAMLNSRHNRERANAVKAISAFDYLSARETLAKMLVDPNPMHRVSALWVVDQLAIFDIVRHVTTLARRDTNPHVRRRAVELLERIAGTSAAPRPISK